MKIDKKVNFGTVVFKRCIFYFALVNDFSICVQTKIWTRVFGQGLWIAASNIRLITIYLLKQHQKPADKSELEVSKYSLQVRLQFQKKEALKWHSVLCLVIVVRKVRRHMKNSFKIQIRKVFCLKQEFETPVLCNQTWTNRVRWIPSVTAACRQHVSWDRCSRATRPRSVPLLYQYT